MTPSGIITTGLQYFEGLSPNDAGNARNRAQLLVLLQQVQDEVENERDGLAYLYKVDATLSIAANASSVALPTDYRDMGPEGSLWIPALNRQLIGPVQQQEIVAARLLVGDAPGEIEHFGIWAGAIQTVKAAQTTILSLYYLQLSPTLTDADTAQFLMPVQYHNTVLLSGMLSRCNGIKDELRDTQKGVFENNKAQFFKRERQRRSALQVMPMQEGVLT